MYLSLEWSPRIEPAIAETIDCELVVRNILNGVTAAADTDF